jgi:hypothetical protein
MMSPGNELASKQVPRMGIVERYPHPFAIAPPITKTYQLRKMPTGRSHEEDPKTSRQVGPAGMHWTSVVLRHVLHRSA